MQQNYKWVIDRIISKYEGKYSNHPKDPGGPTMYGITYIDLAEHMGVSKRQTYGMMEHMSLNTAEDIYAQKYAKGVHFNELASGIDMVCLDYGINSGIGRPIKVLQAILGLRQSGIMDSATISAANKQDPYKLIDAMCDERLAFMKRIKQGELWKSFGNGWGARVADLRITAKSLVSRTEVVDPIVAPISLLTARATYIDGAPAKAVLKTAAGASVIGGGSSGAVTQDLLTMGIVVLGIVVVGGLTYYELKRSQRLAQDLVMLPLSATTLLPHSHSH